MQFTAEPRLSEFRFLSTFLAVAAAHRMGFELSFCDQGVASIIRSVISSRLVRWLRASTWRVVLDQWICHFRAIF